jgi:carbon-monoxide dehydrogenase small subunit/isoquinoline 1-oxidoreductase alpha subunit/xanthine dehydrogenase YagT iron-sulfur-binding subunit
LSVIQQAYVDHTAFQCSYCTPEFSLTTRALLEEKPRATRQEAQEYLAGNLCRCGSYVKIMDVVKDARDRAVLGVAAPLSRCTRARAAFGLR